VEVLRIRKNPSRVSMAALGKLGLASAVCMLERLKQMVVVYVGHVQARTKIEKAVMRL